MAKIFDYLFIFLDFINMLLIFLVFNSIFGGNDDKKDS